MSKDSIQQDFFDLCRDLRKSIQNATYNTFDTSNDIDSETVFNPMDDSIPSLSENPLGPLERARDLNLSYYVGLPSSPTLVLPVFNDKFATVWEDMGTHIYKYLDSVAVRWTTIDVVHFVEPSTNVRMNGREVDVLWIGVIPGSLSRELAKEAARVCKNILISFDIDGFEIQFRESFFRRYIGPRLIDFQDSIPGEKLTAGITNPITTALGLPIASRQHRHAEGTGGLYLSAGGSSEAVYVLTARHVVLPFDDFYNKPYYRRVKSERSEVMLLGPDAFQGLLKSVMLHIALNDAFVKQYHEALDKLQREEEGRGTDGVNARREKIESALRKAKVSIEELNSFYNVVMKIWSQENLRIIGQVLYAPPISVAEGPKRYSEDWALIELDRTKINWPNFKGNVIDYGAEMLTSEFRSLMYNYPSSSPFNIKYPESRLPYERFFPIKGVVPEHELTHPKKPYTKNGKLCNTLFKNGARTKTTVGYDNGIKSFVREYLPDGTELTSMEFAILSAHHRKEFSNRGDSGAIIVDGEGRAAALLIGGAGKLTSADVTYGTPFEWLMERIKAKLPNVHLYPTDAQEYQMDLGVPTSTISFSSSFNLGFP
ncbi:hypothetical protein BDQ17DRAFT_1366847 [Cyathus striatus]|nr:hypothetical protein BDQ17DRAFT_1366847 [Cyathus striatus]